MSTITDEFPRTMKWMPESLSDDTQDPKLGWYNTRNELIREATADEINATIDWRVCCGQPAHGFETA